MTRVIDSYVHNGAIGVLVELECLDDATPKTKIFQKLHKDLAMQVAALNPSFVSPRFSASVLPIRPGLNTEKAVEAVKDNEALLSQYFVKDGKMTVAEVIKVAERELAEKIRVVRFVRYQAGET